MEKTEMHKAFETRYGTSWGDPDFRKEEIVFAEGWNARRSTAIQDIEQNVLPQIGRQNRGVKLCIEVLNK